MGIRLRKLWRRIEVAAHYPRFTLLIVAAALLLRLCWILIVPVGPESDSVAYERFARNLYEHGTFGWTPTEPFAFWPPGTSLLYAGLFYLFGPSYLAISLTNMVLSVGIILLAMSLAKLFFDRRTAIICGVIMAVWPTLVMYNTILASELPFLFATLAALRIWAGSGSATMRAIGAGLLLGIACYIRPLALMLPLVYAVSFFALEREKGKLVEQTRILVISSLVMLAVIAPWTYRNYALYDEVVLISTNGGITFWMGNTPGTRGDYAEPPQWALDLPDNQRARALKTRAIEYIKADPAAFVSRSVKKAAMLHNKETVGVYWNRLGILEALGPNWAGPLKLLSTGFWLTILALALVGAAALFRRTGMAGIFHPLILPWIYFTAIHSITVATDRYHLSFAAHVAILAAVGLTVILAHLGRRRGPHA